MDADDPLTSHRRRGMLPLSCQHDLAAAPPVVARLVYTPYTRMGVRKSFNALEGKRGRPARRRATARPSVPTYAQLACHPIRMRC